MAENDRHQHLSRQSSRKCTFRDLIIDNESFSSRYFLARSPVMSTILQVKESPSSPESSNTTGNPSGNPSRSRQLWTRAVESVLEHEKTSPISTATNEPIGWYNLTKR